MGLESNFQSRTLAYLNGLPGCRAENVSGNANQSGRPDINGCYNGRMFKIELKSPDHKYQPSKKQQIELRKWANAGCVVAVAYSLDFIKYLFEEGDWDPPADFHCDEQQNGCHSWYHIPPMKGAKLYHGTVNQPHHH